jgi:hypothetical protein
MTGWDWMLEEYPDGIRLLLARGVTPERILEAFGADPSDAVPLSAEQALETLDSWVQVGQTGEWGFAIDNSSPVIAESGLLTRALSAGTDVALVETGPNFDHFYYFADGTEVTSFEPLLSYYRDGTDPDRFVSQMREAGLPVEPPDDDDDDEGDPRLAVLEMLTLALGIRLPTDVAMGPLLTAAAGA